MTAYFAFSTATKKITKCCMKVCRQPMKTVLHFAFSCKNFDFIDVLEKKAKVKFLPGGATIFCHF
jgi:hypothetical protein